VERDHVDSGGENVLIDSGATAQTVDGCLVPALRREGLELTDIAWLLNTHCHGDHIGGHYRIRELAGVKTATFRGSLAKLRDPLQYSKAIRSRFPDFSPPPQPVLRGVEPDRLLDDGGRVAGRLRLVFTPGHDDDAVCWYDEATQTLISGDSLQGNGTESSGIGFYQDLVTYRTALQRLAGMTIANICAGHPYVPGGAVALGAEEVSAYLKTCFNFTEYYDQLITAAWEAGERDPAVIARQIIKKSGGPVPRYLFLALYTVTAHLKIRR
jgi:hydroxyacylglutathione hydrolase